MWYKGNSHIDHQRAKEKLAKLIEQKKDFEIKEKRQRRTISQNSYMHLILGWFGLEKGYTLEEVKQDIFKKVVNPETFYEGEHGTIVKVQRWRSTRDLNTKELTFCIDRFRNYSTMKADLYLPEPKDLNWLREIEIEIENNREFL